MRVLLTGGGTAGHINPALAIAETIRYNDPHAEIEFVGIAGGKENDLVPREGYRLHHVKSMGLRRSLSPSNIKALYLALFSPYFKSTTSILDTFKPDIVIGTGGYACWPLMAAAARRGIPTAVHESNALPGLAVKQLQKRVDRIWINFEATREKLRTSRPIVRVGNPMKQAFGATSYAAAREALGIPKDTTFILSFGGSLGAEAINRAVIDFMSTQGKDRKNLLHLHASGKRDYAETKAQFDAQGLQDSRSCILQDYIYDMPMQMAAADIVIARAGAMTLSELALLQKACVLIPSPHVADNHQYKNAKALADADAALLVEEKELADGALTRALNELLASEERRETLCKNIRSFADADANARIWKEILELTTSK
ncbi:MAG: undecaprenyldiphospho-muramoylpentapeptide beta-N-acetylglucosaminyltransferase [Clostridia bacterium]|nr:undecaprenyldiphospho-muramoylpentapeptide beta-N-acetylglucosaminyltransferase [Clostridia bacterium]